MGEPYEAKDWPSYDGDCADADDLLDALPQQGRDASKAAGKVRRRVAVTVIVEDWFPADYSEESTQFYVEENHCLGNYLQQAAAFDAARSKFGMCSVCHITTAKLLPLDPTPEPPK